MKEEKALIIAVDFDGTLCSDNYPEIGTANEALIRRLIEYRKNGSRLILWTCRRGDYLEAAVDYCKCYGLYFDAVNENLPEILERFDGDSRKIYADIYIDDRCSKPWEALMIKNPA